MTNLPPEILAYYAAGLEQRRLEQGPFQLERARTQEIVLRHVPAPPRNPAPKAGSSRCCRAMRASSPKPTAGEGRVLEMPLEQPGKQRGKPRDPGRDQGATWSQHPPGLSKRLQPVGPVREVVQRSEEEHDILGAHLIAVARR